MKEVMAKTDMKKTKAGAGSHNPPRCPKCGRQTFHKHSRLLSGDSGSSIGALTGSAKVMDSSLGGVRDPEYDE